MMIEERQRVRNDDDLSVIDRDRLSAALKMVANAGGLLHSRRIYESLRVLTRRSSF